LEPLECGTQQTTIRDFIAFPKNNMGVLALGWGTARGFKQIEP